MGIIEELLLFIFTGEVLVAEERSGALLSSVLRESVSEADSTGVAAIDSDETSAISSLVNRIYCLILSALASDSSPYVDLDAYLVEFLGVKFRLYSGSMK